MAEAVAASEVPVANGAPAKLTAAEKKRLKRQKTKSNKKELKVEAAKVHESLQVQRAAEQRRKAGDKGPVAAGSDTPAASGEPEVIIEYISAPLEGLEELKAAHAEAQGGAADPLKGIAVEGLFIKPEEEASNPYAEMERLVAHFGTAEAMYGPGEDEDAEEEEPAPKEAGAEVKEGDEGEEADSDDEDEISRKKRKLDLRMGIAALKAECARPEVVEVWDVTAQDPKLLVYLKAYRNTVPVPRHWSQKRKFLQGKRGIEKPPFELPAFIQTTGVGDMRNAQEENAEMKMKNKGRNRMRPKMGKMDIDYNVLHNAFFKFQEKPRLTCTGDLYYEGKEFEMAPSDAYPGVLSPVLRDALGMQPNQPPPWLINMQYYGPPPSYPSLKIPGLSAPIPPGAEFGKGIGQWGLPPVDESGKPVYGDVFGENDDEGDGIDLETKTHRWGELEEEASSSDESSDEEDDDAGGLTAAQLEEGIASGALTGAASDVPSGVATGSTLDLRKTPGGGGTSTFAGSVAQPSLYTVLPEQAAPAQDGGLMAVSHTYAMPTAEAPRPADPAARARQEMLAAAGGGGAAGSVDVALDPEELASMSAAQLEELYSTQTGAAPREDYSDMLASHAAAKKRKLQEQASSKASKKAKETFKF